MHIKLGTGTFGSPDGWAITGFENLTVGDITDNTMQFSNLNTNNDCQFEIAVYGIRTPH
jgi:hypothetical protein